MYILAVIKVEGSYQTKPNGCQLAVCHNLLMTDIQHFGIVAYCHISIIPTTIPVAVALE